MNYGLIVKPPEPEHFIFGAGQLGDAPVLTDGDWSSWLPVPEVQNVAIEPMACVSFSTLNAVETMVRQKYGQNRNFSDRFLALISGTTTQGNDPNTVAEALRKSGDVSETYWPYTPIEDTWEKFYAVPPKNLHTLALEFKAEFAFGHSWVTNPTQQRMMDALNYSPLTAGVHAWSSNGDIYYRPTGASSNHDVMIFGYLRNNYWLIFDSYSNSGTVIKKLAWDYDFEAVKRFTLNRNVNNTPQAESAWQRFLNLMLQIYNAFQKVAGLGDYHPDRTLGAERSPKWPQFKRDFEKTHPKACAVCGTTKGLQLHHVSSFATHPELELSMDNVRWLCEGSGTLDHHRGMGHLGSFQSLNENLKEDTLIWKDKFENRPKWNGVQWVYPAISK